MTQRSVRRRFPRRTAPRTVRCPPVRPGAATERRTSAPMRSVPTVPVPLHRPASHFVGHGNATDHGGGRRGTGNEPGQPAPDQCEQRSASEYARRTEANLVLRRVTEREYQLGERAKPGPTAALRSCSPSAPATRWRSLRGFSSRCRPWRQSEDPDGDVQHDGQPENNRYGVGTMTTVMARVRATTDRARHQAPRSSVRTFSLTATSSSDSMPGPWYGPRSVWSKRLRQRLVSRGAHDSPRVVEKDLRRLRLPRTPFRVVAEPAVRARHRDPRELLDPLIFRFEFVATATGPPGTHRQATRRAVGVSAECRRPCSAHPSAAVTQSEGSSKRKRQSPLATPGLTAPSGAARNPK